MLIFTELLQKALFLAKIQDLNRILFFLVFLIFLMKGHAQETQNLGKQINIVYGANFTKDEANFPGASIFSKDTRQVQFEHQGADLWCDIAIFYQKENRLQAIGNVRLQQGDSVQMTSGRINYDGDTRLAKAYESVLLRNTTKSSSMTLTTDTLYFDREKTGIIL